MTVSKKTQRPKAALSAFFEMTTNVYINLTKRDKREIKVRFFFLLNVKYIVKYFTFIWRLSDMIFKTTFRWLLK